jgi:hypothetical protein
MKATRKECPDMHSECRRWVKSRYLGARGLHGDLRAKARHGMIGRLVAATTGYAVIP